jgi:hypothetical protein
MPNPVVEKILCRRPPVFARFPATPNPAPRKFALMPTQLALDPEAQPGISAPPATNPALAEI